jgi:ribonuclease HI
MVKLFTDGGARGNPGPAGIGGVFYKDDSKIADFSKYIGETTNNQAEYQALEHGLKLAIKNNIEELECYLDSELVVKQLNKEYKVKNKELAIVFVRVWNLSLKFKKITFAHVRREYNKEADSLVNIALDEPR